jgi:predicted nuclease of predicted toxin-antitoxin system
MKFPLDESADARLAAFLIARGHDVTAIARDYAQALPDWAVLAIAHRERRVLIANDRDFGELVIRQRLPHAGVILFRLTPIDLASKIARLDDVLTHYGEELDQFIVVTDRRIRVRRA